MPTVLVVDDEPPMRELLRLYLERDGFAVREAADGEEALAEAGRGCDLVVLDLMLPGLDGWEVCRRLRGAGGIPILVLSARGEVEDRVHGLELGADDYMVKPFAPQELVARVRALLRRSGTAGPLQPLDFPGLRIDPLRREVLVGDEPVACSPKEFDLLHFLARSPGRVFTREQLLREVWGESLYGETRTVDSHVKNLRDRLGRDRPWIATVWGVGYKFQAPEA